ncbi:hypothetical protein DBV15_08480, partial [Temnothorax longispinosus]
TLRNGIAKYEIVAKRLRAENRKQKAHCRSAFHTYFAIPSRNAMFFVLCRPR